MMEMLQEGDNLWDYSVSWIDCTAGGLDLGRGEVSFGRHAEPDELPFNVRSKPFDIPSQVSVELPCTPPLSLVGSLTTKLFNELYLRRGGPRTKRHLMVHYDKFFYPLDALRAWNRLYGKNGFIQYQFVVPFDAGFNVVRQILETCRQAGHIPSLSVLKRLGAGNGLLSFPIPGWTLAIDLPVKPGLLPMLDEFDRLIVDHGGRVYLAKDARLSPQAFRAMYPEFPAWLSIKRKVDPEDLFSSDLSRRLKLSMEEAN
jgi:decaprenylphospho-beta-D-ribofuranose 2-oxidase